MPQVQINGVWFEPNRHGMAIVKAGAEHHLMDNSYRKDIYGDPKREFMLGFDLLPIGDHNRLVAIYIAGGSFTYVDLTGASYTVAFKGFDLRLVTQPPWNGRTYQGDIVLREA